jgi:NADPH-dependent 2,4-dienoyl-CoA reductase/sulfur reductase-like enzyme
MIVGAGPAGMAAAIAAAETGLEPIVVDEQARPGGQIYRQSPPSLSAPAISRRDRAAQRGAELLRRFHALAGRITLHADTDVWAIFPPRKLALRGSDGSPTWEADHLILAPGAYEYVPPFPGWTLPGVMTPGAAQHLVKTMHVRPGKRALVAGTGPFLLVVAEQLQRAGVQVIGIVEAAHVGTWSRALPRLAQHPLLLTEGLGYLYRIKRLGIPIHRGQLVVEARGQGEVSEVVVAPCDAQWRPDRSRQRTETVDTLCVGYGFVPRTQLAQMGGCRMRFVGERGGWIPEVDTDLQTSVAGISVTGDGGGVAGALVAQEEGNLAGLAAACRLGTLDPRSFARARRPILCRLARLRHFRAALDEVSRLRIGLTTLATPDTIVCRCEELTQAEIATGISFGGNAVRTLKVMTRLGMGPCQGRMCWPAIARWMAAATGKTMEDIGPLSARPPITPLTLGDLLDSQVSAKGPSQTPSVHEVTP